MTDEMQAEQPALRLTVLGTRGSMTVCRADGLAYGGNTSCYMVQAGEETIFLDAGSGLLRAPTEFQKPPVILLSHLHLDHILGLGMYQRLSHRGAETVLYLQAENETQGKALIDGVYSPPYWPVSLSDYAGTLRILPFPPKLTIGEVDVETIPGNHPGDSLVIKLCRRGRTLVYASDFEATEPAFTELIRFARGADLVLFDGQYTDGEYRVRTGFGHSSYEKGTELLERGRVKQLLLVHHDPQNSDLELSRREADLTDPGIRFAREGEVITL